MDVPECNVCHVALDEDEHQPRHLGCSHDACMACIKVLMKNSSFECPLCRRVIKAKTEEDLPINHGAVQILRIFKGLKRIISENKQNEAATAYIKDVCIIHKCVVDMRCNTCKVWICEQCKEFHIADIGCELQDCNDFVKKLKEEHKEVVKPTILSVRNNLRLLSSKSSEIGIEKKRLEEEIEKLDNLHKNMQKAVKDGTNVLDEIVSAAAKVEEASTSKEINESMDIANEWYQFAQVWCKRYALSGHGDSLLEKLKSGQEVYASIDIKGKSRHCKLSIEDNIYLHCFRINEFINKSFKTFPYEQIQSWLPAVRDLVFLDLAICGEVKGRVTIRLRQDLPIYAINIPLLFTGEMGHSLLGLCFMSGDSDNMCIEVSSITNKMHNFKQDSNAGHMASQGSILAYWENCNIDSFYIYHEQGTEPYDNHYGTELYDDEYEVFGLVETGLDTVKLCRNHKKQHEVSVVDCGLVIKENLLKKKLITL